MSGAHGHAGGDHHGGNKGIALLIALLALVLAFAETLGKSAQTAGLIHHVEASNLWAFFQAKTVRQTTLRTAAELLDAQAHTDAAKKQAAKWRDTAQRYQSEPETNEGRDQLMARAKEQEEKRKKAFDAYHHFETASASVQIAIVLASASIITGFVAFAWVAGGLGIIGIIFSVIGVFFPTQVHLF